MEGKKEEKEDMDGGLMYQQLRKFINVIVSQYSIFTHLIHIGRTKRCRALTIY